ncbi:MAG: aspartate aminotransferase family protein [Clostridiales bacterium]|nr:aspartate aminotransferase family protein [Clostridiales bacterium]
MNIGNEKTIDNDLYLISDYDKKYCMQVFGPQQIAFTHGKGVYLYDTEGKKYMDMIGGIAVNSVGHGNPKLVNAISDQAKKVIHCCNYYLIPQRSELAYNLCRKSFADKCFFANSGAEANEGAIKLARGFFSHKGIDRYEIITANMSFHGRTMATVTATGQPKFSEPFKPVVPGFKYAEFNNLESFKSQVTEHTAAIMLELIQGESGVHPADKSFIQGIKQLCEDKNILLIIDEVQTGIGRTGTLFCYEQYGITPDIMTLAKGLGGGVPIGAVLATNEAATGFQLGDHGSTFGGNPLCCAAANAVLEIIAENQLCFNAGTISEFIVNKVNQIKEKRGYIKEVRGMGLLIGIEFDERIMASGMRDALREKGFLVSSIGQSVIRIAPPLIIKEAEAAKFCAALDQVLKETAKASKNKIGLELIK